MLSSDDKNFQEKYKKFKDELLTNLKGLNLLSGNKEIQSKAGQGKQKEASRTIYDHTGWKKFYDDNKENVAEILNKALDVACDSIFLLPRERKKVDEWLASQNSLAQGHFKILVEQYKALIWQGLVAEDILKNISIPLRYLMFAGDYPVPSDQTPEEMNGDAMKNYGLAIKSKFPSTFNDLKSHLEEVFKGILISEKGFEKDQYDLKFFDALLLSLSGKFSQSEVENDSQRDQKKLADFLDLLDTVMQSKDAFQKRRLVRTISLVWKEMRPIVAGHIDAIRLEESQKEAVQEVNAAKMKEKNEALLERLHSLEKENAKLIDRVKEDEDCVRNAGIKEKEAMKAQEILTEQNQALVTQNSALSKKIQEVTEQNSRLQGINKVISKERDEAKADLEKTKGEMENRIEAEVSNRTVEYETERRKAVAESNECKKETTELNSKVKALEANKKEKGGLIQGARPSHVKRGILTGVLVLLALGCVVAAAIACPLFMPVVVVGFKLSLPLLMASAGLAVAAVVNIYSHYKANKDYKKLEGVFSATAIQPGHDRKGKAKILTIDDRDMSGDSSGSSNLVGV